MKQPETLLKNPNNPFNIIFFLAFSYRLFSLSTPSKTLEGLFQSAPVMFFFNVWLEIFPLLITPIANATLKALHTSFEKGIFQTGMKGKESFTSLSYSNDPTRDTCVAGLLEISYSIMTGLGRRQYLNFRSQPQAQGSSPSGTSLTTSAGIWPSNEDELLELSTAISDIHCGSLWGRTHTPGTASHVFHWTIAFHLSSRLWNLEELPHQAAAPSLPLTSAVPAAPP